MREFVSSLFSKILITGEASIPRTSLSSTAQLSSGVTYIQYFQAERSENINNVIVRTGATAGASLTLFRIGIYTLDWSTVPSGAFVFFFGLEPGDMHQIAATANNTSVLGSANTSYTIPLASTWYKERGVRYGISVLGTTSSGTMPSLVGQATLSASTYGGILGTAPAIAEVVTSQTDLSQRYMRNSYQPVWNDGSGNHNIGNTTSGSNIVTLTAAAGQMNTAGAFTADIVGQPITGTGIPSNTTITAWNSFTSIAISQNATSTNANIALTIGPSLWSPTTAPRLHYLEFTP